ncbi:right-handed parallel beta-helix repeat-containing protein [Gemmatimonadota bacterium]
MEWLISGDDNLNGVVLVRYRKKTEGEGQWLDGMPLRRVPAGSSVGTSPIFSWKNKHSGSIFALEPATTYEIALSLSDPDGGIAEKTLTATTRAVPAAASDGVVKQVSPETYTSVVYAADPGDILELSAGYYGNAFTTRNGEPGRPIVIRPDSLSTDSGSVIFDRFSLSYRKHVILQGVTVNGKVDLFGAEEVAVIGCTVNAPYGIVASESPGATNCYIADNVLSYTVTWEESSLGVDGDNYGEGIQLTGPGNVICYNRVTGYRDCISTMEDNEVYNQMCIDIYNNDIYTGVDDAVEADFCMGNCRVYNNRITNCFMGVSSQPGLGGPTYIMRNVMYNIINCPFKLSRGSKGDVLLHNTIVKVGTGFYIVHDPTYVYSRNNLAIGGIGDGIFGKWESGQARAMDFARADGTADFDYDGLGTHGAPFAAKIGGLGGDFLYLSLSDLQANSTEKHAVEVDMNVFDTDVEWPSPPFPGREPANLRLASGSAAEDAGLVIPNINDGFSGTAPDLGAYEIGAPLPHYGPRPAGGIVGCDFNADGQINITDVIALILYQRAYPDDLGGDFNRDGSVDLTDAITLLLTIMRESCPS